VLNPEKAAPINPQMAIAKEKQTTVLRGSQKEHPVKYRKRAPKHNESFGSDTQVPGRNQGAKPQ
jgi:hypothetical protein